MYLRPDEVAKVLENAGLNVYIQLMKRMVIKREGIMFMLIVNLIWAEQH